MTDLTTFIEQLNTSSAQTLADLDQVQHSLAATMQQIQRATALTQFDQDALRAFFAKQSPDKLEIASQSALAMTQRSKGS